jgi:predicted DNA-binding transcriptional regulator AlpA
MEILLKDDVMNQLKISQATLYHWVSESRTGEGTFPLPITQPGKTLRWNSDAIDAWCQSRKQENMPSVLSTKVTAKERQQRQKAMLAALERHGLAEKPK